MKAKRLTALALAALMAASTTSVALADRGVVNKDQALNFYAGAVGDDLYMMDEDGYIRAAVDGDFAPGDDIYLALMDDGSASKTDIKRMNVYTDWAVGKSWVDDVEIVYKKGQWKTSEASKKIYTVQGTGITALDNVSVTTSKTEASSIRSEILAELEKKRSAAESEVFSGYKTDPAYKYNGQTYTDKKDLVNAATGPDKLYEYQPVYYKVGDSETIQFAEPSSVSAGIKKGDLIFDNVSSAIQEAVKNDGWVKYEEGTHGTTYYVSADNESTTMGTISDSSNGTQLKDYLSSKGIAAADVYLNVTNKKFVVDKTISFSDLATQLDGSYSNIADKTYYQESEGQKKVLTVKTESDGYFKAGTTELVGNLDAACQDMIDNHKAENVTVYTIDGDSKVDEATAKTAAAKKVQTIFDEIKNSGKYIGAGVEAPATFSGNPTGSYDGYNTESGYAYWVKISTKESTGTKDIDLVGDISIGRTKTSAKGNEVTLGVTLTNQNNQNAGDYTDVDSDVYIEPGERAVVSFADDAGDVVVEFGDDAWFEFNARGQGKLNLAYNTKYNKDFAYDYDDANIDFINFEGEPTTNRTGTLYIYADEDSYIYEVTSKGAKKINGAYYDDDEEAWVIRTRNLTSYAISDKKLKTVDQMNNGSSSSSGSKPGSNSGSGSNNGKPNPDTGR